MNKKIAKLGSMEENYRNFLKVVFGGIDVFPLERSDMFDIITFINNALKPAECEVVVGYYGLLGLRKLSSADLSKKMRYSVKWIEKLRRMARLRLGNPKNAPQLRKYLAMKNDISLPAEIKNEMVEKQGGDFGKREEFKEVYAQGIAV